MEKEEETPNSVSSKNSKNTQVFVSEEFLELENIPSVVPIQDELRTRIFDKEKGEKAETSFADSPLHNLSVTTLTQTQNPSKSTLQRFIKKSYSVPFSEDDSDSDDEKEANKVVQRRCASALPESSRSERLRRLFSPKSKSNRIADSGIGEEGSQDPEQCQNEEGQNSTGENDNSENETEEIKGEPESQIENEDAEDRGDVVIPISSGESRDSHSDSDLSTHRISRLRVIVNAQAACNAMMEQARQNIFLESMQCLYGVLLVGYTCLLVPFKVEYQYGKYSIQRSWIRMIIVTTLLSASFVQQCAYANLIVGEVQNVKKNPEIAFDAAQQYAYALLILAFTYAFTTKKGKLDDMFSTFNSINPGLNKLQNPLLIRVVCVVTSLLGAFSLWMSLGKEFSHLLDFELWEESLLQIPNALFGIELPNNHFLSFFIAISLFYFELVKHYIDFLMVACAFTLYVMEKKAREYCLRDDFDIERATEVFRQIKLLVHKINMAFGTITVVYNVVVVLYGVYTITSMFQQLQWEKIIICIVKLGVIFLAAEGCANADNLVEQILTYKIRYVKKSVENIKDLDVKVEHLNQVSEFQNVSKRAICLTGMDFFDVNHPLLGTVGLAVLTYILLIFEWKLDCKCDCEKGPEIHFSEE